MGITRSDLDNLSQLDKEIDDIDRQIHNLKNKIYRTNNYVGDTVRDYSIEAKGKIVIIRGYNHKRYEKKMEDLIDQMAEAKVNYLDELAKLQDDIKGIDDSEIRRIIRLKFVEGLSWPNVAKRMGPYATEDSVRMKLDRYIK